MAITVPIAVQLAVGSFNATSTSNQVAWSIEVETRESTTWGSGAFQQHVPSLRTLDVAIGGYNDYAAGAWDEYQRTAQGTPQIVTLAPDTAAVGTLSVMANGLMPAATNFDASVGDISTINATIVGGIVFPPMAEGQVTRASGTNITATTTTTPVNLGSIVATQHVVAAVHVFTYSGTGTLIFQLQSSATSGGSYANRGTAGAAISAAGAQWITATGLAVSGEPFWRLNVTASASPVANVLASIAIFTP